ncbi:hypothetical protein ACROYT_G013405 [Oculina patagonica]
MDTLTTKFREVRGKRGGELGCYVDIQASIKTDHSSIILELEDIKDSQRGPGFWKLNTSLLARPDYVEMISKELPNWLEDARDLSDKRAKWDWLKFKIKTSSIIYSKQLSKDRQRREEELNARHQDMLRKFQENPCETTRLETEKLKSELEALYDEKVEGIIIRSRAMWHEHGEKNTKYFLNLEKRNNIKKHIRKLFVSGSISTDPFEILNAEKCFYRKLYSKQKVNLNGDEANFFFQNPNLKRLSEELSTNCEGEITLQECENILGSFHTGKTPGNDGIPIEFYKAFWPLLGKFMVDSFNEAFYKKEMSHSQKQAVITLIEKKGKERNYLENWRPISLTNVDAKIASKVIAARVIKVLPEIIHCNQTGYVKGRFIGEAARSIIDIMDCTKKQNIPESFTIPRQSEGCLPCPRGTFSFSGWSECRPWLNCSEIALQVHAREQIPGGMIKGTWLADWEGHQVVFVNCSRPSFKRICLRGMTWMERLQGPFVTRLIGKCYDKQEIVTMYYKHGSANTLGRLLQQPQFSHHNNIQTRFQLCMDYVKIMNFMHCSPSGILVMCDTPTLRKLLSQYLITDDFHLVINDLDSTQEVTRDKGLECKQQELGKFFAPEQKWPNVSTSLRLDMTLTYDEKVDIWKIPAVVEKLLDSVNGSDFAKSKLERIMERCRATDPQQRPTANEVLQEFLRLQQLITQ